MEWLLNNAPAIILSAAALIISIKSWHKARVFYDIEIHDIGGFSKDWELSNIKEKLNTGKYTILNTYEDDRFTLGSNNAKTVFIILGKITK